MSLTIGHNIASLRAQRSLTRSSDSLSRVFERLASGQRINRVSDDAAGLSIASALRSDIGIYTQGMRNINDGLSLLAVADGALQELTTIVTRQLELAEQAANGVYTAKQRIALHNEANALVSEFNRIVALSEFNDINPLEDPTLAIHIQAGVGENGILTSKPGESFARNAGDGTFADAVSITAGQQPRPIAVGDFDNDGNLDFANIQENGNRLHINLGAGDGTFVDFTDYGDGTSLNQTLETGDLNGDGHLDLVAGSYSSNDVVIFLGNGDGTFQDKTLHDTGSASNWLAAGLVDLNNDNILDLVTSHDGEISTSLGLGDGTFTNATVTAAGASLQDPLVFGDINSDGIMDLIRSEGSDNSFSVYFGDGGGGFATTEVYNLGDTVRGVSVGDFNLDGYVDVAATQQTTGVQILLNDGNGSLVDGAFLSSAGTVVGIATTDVNSDGIADISTVEFGSGLLRNYQGKGDGTFTEVSSLSAGANAGSVRFADFNNDTVQDALVGFVSAGTTISYFQGNVDQVSTQAHVDLSTQEQARTALSDLESTLLRITRARGTIGASQSRFEVAARTLDSTRANYENALSRIRDADVAAEAAEAVRLSILQQTASAILAQANQQPALILALLE